MLLNLRTVTSTWQCMRAATKIIHSYINVKILILPSKSDVIMDKQKKIKLILNVKLYLKRCRFNT